MAASDSPVAIDCFCGAGGLSLGLMQAGFTIAFAFDHDADSVGTYRRNLGDHVIQASIETLDRDIVRQAIQRHGGHCDIVAGGPPCQGFSVQRRGKDSDGRNDLVLAFLDLVLEVAPTYFLMENVAALRGRRGQAHLQKLIERAAEAGYRTHLRVLNAADYAVPQIRKRVFLVGEVDDGSQYFRFPEPSRASDEYLTVQEAIGDLSSPARDCGIPNHEPDSISELNRIRISHVPAGGGREDIPPELRLPCHRLGPDKIGHRGVYGRLAWDRPASTITTKCNSFTRGRFAHPSENRNITMREAARLQGFPDEFVFLSNKVSVAHQIGNAVPPPLARTLGEALVCAIRNRALGRGGTPTARQTSFGF